MSSHGGGHGSHAPKASSGGGGGDHMELAKGAGGLAVGVALGATMWIAEAISNIF